MDVVLTRERGRNERLRAWLPEGATVREVPLTSTRSYDQDVVRAALDAASREGLSRALVVTSARAAPYATIARASLEEGAELFSVGPATTKALAEVGLVVQAQSLGPASDLANQVSRGPVLLLGARHMSAGLAKGLGDRGLLVHEVACYETVAETPDGPGARALADADVIFIGAPSAWSVAAPLVGREAWVVVPGPTTEAVVRAVHERVVVGWGPSVAERLSSL